MWGSTGLKPWTPSTVADIDGRAEALGHPKSEGALAFKVGIYPLFDLVAAFISGIETYPK
jgi:hypothetical protein